MELFRQEYELKKPKNWGKIAFENINKRAQELKSSSSKTLAVKDAVRKELESHLVVSGPLDATGILQSLNEDDQCEFFSKYARCSSLKLQRWNHMEGRVFRCISITMGASLLELDLSFSRVDSSHLEILMAHIHALQVLKLSNCPCLDGSSVQMIAKMQSHSLIEFHVSNCPMFRIEPLLCIGGCVGVGANPLFKLRALNLAHCPAQDKGLIGVATGCKQIRFLNLEGCIDISDVGVCAVIKSSKHLQLLNLSGCSWITNKSVLALAAHCPHLISINLTRCSNVTDPALITLAKSCPKLQAASFVGLSSVSESCMFELCQNCKGLLMLNLSGCNHISTNGLKHMIKGLNYVQLSVSFVGFHPIDHHVEQKLSDHLEMIRESALEHIRQGIEKRVKKQAMKDKHMEKIRNRAASIIQQYMFRYCRRLLYYKMWQNRLRRENALFIQRIWRGHRGRSLARQCRIEWNKFLLNTPFALKIQRTVRGHLSRTRSSHIFLVLREMFQWRRREAFTALAIRLQACARKYLAKKRVQAWREVCQRRGLDERNAATTIQKLGRKFICIIRVQGMRFERQRKIEREDRAARLIQGFYARAMIRYLNKLDGKALLKVQHRRVQATILLLRVYRGHRGREMARKERIYEASRHFAAIQIQRIYRGMRILHWKDIRLNTIAAFVLDRHYLERGTSLENARLRYKNYIIENRRDSASDPDEEYPENEWVEMYDPKKKRPYWICETTNEVTYDEPAQPCAHEKSLVGLRVKVYWVVQGAWYEGVVSRFHRRKHRHRIEYDDTDHEWIDFDTEYDRVQVQLEDGSWMMYLLYQSEGQSSERRKKEKAEEDAKYKKQAFDDALQWEVIKDDRSNNIVYMSGVTGEIRIGAHGSENWVVQDDGYGYPCFYNMGTNETVHEDPRFIHDTDLDLVATRNYVMDEMRFAMYFCKDYWDKYKKAVEQDKKTEVRLIVLQVLNSPKPKHLNSFLLRATALFKSSSVVDIPMNQTEKQEIEYARWLVARMHELAEQGSDIIALRKEHKKAAVTALTNQPVKMVACRFCGRESRRNLDFCPTCGHRLIW